MITLDKLHLKGIFVKNKKISRLRIEKLQELSTCVGFIQALEERLGHKLSLPFRIASDTFDKLVEITDYHPMIYDMIGWLSPIIIVDRDHR